MPKKYNDRGKYTDTTRKQTLCLFTSTWDFPDVIKFRSRHTFLVSSSRFFSMLGSIFGFIFFNYCTIVRRRWAPVRGAL